MKFFLLFILIIISHFVNAQSPDTIRMRTDSMAKQDGLRAVPDSFSINPLLKNKWSVANDIDDSSAAFTWEILTRHPYFGFKTQPTTAPPAEYRKHQGKEILFYLIVFLLMLFALLQRAFPKYFSDLFRLFFRTTLKQRQLREQLMQTPVPSLFLNIFFVLTGSLYLGFLVEHYQLNSVGNFWLLVLYCSIGLATIYFIKYIGLKFSGWLFNAEEAADSYIFIIFIINKILGIMLLPFLILLAFSVGGIYQASLTLSLCVIAGLLVYRFILTYAAVRNQVKVNPFHFFLYILAFEVAPLLLVYKALLVFLRITA